MCEIQRSGLLHKDDPKQKSYQACIKEQLHYSYIISCYIRKEKDSLNQI